MSDIEDGELLSSESEDCIQPLSQKEEKSKNKVKNYVDTNNNQTYLIDRNFPKNDDNNRFYRKRDSNSPKYHDRKRKHHNKLELIENKKHRKSSEHKEKEYISPKKPEIVELNIDYQKIEETNPIKRKILCKYYASGECKNGPGCAFMHEEFPCKFFHDKTTNCRAGDECKYSHAPLSDDMKSVMVSFIQDGKEHKPTFSTPTFNTNVPVHNRTKCLLPTPVLEPQVSNLSQTQFHKPVLYGDFCDIDPYEETLLHNLNNYPPRYVNSNIRNSYSLNKPRLVDQDYRLKPVPNNYARIQPDFIPKNNFMPSIDSVGKSYSEHYRNDFNSTNFGPLSPPEINFQEPPPYDVGINQQQNNTHSNVSYNNHAPARFIVGINKNVSKTIDNTVEENFKKALKILADSVTLPEMSSNSDNLKSNNENQENVPYEKIQETCKGYPIKLEKVATSIQNEKKSFPKNYTSFKTNHSSTSQTKVLRNSKIQENAVPSSIQQDTFCKSFIKQESTNYQSFVSGKAEYSPIQPTNNQETVTYSPVTQENTFYSSNHQNIKQEKVSYSPVQSNTIQEKVSYSPVQSNTIQEKVSYSPVQSNTIQEKVSYSPIQPEKITYSSAPSNIKQEAISGAILSGHCLLENESNNLIKEEPILNPAIRIADNVSIFNINENELSDSERQYIEEMRSLINLDAQFENRIPWVAMKLEPILKQPYVLYRLKVNEVHENAISDPRLTGHPVLYELEALNDPDEIPNANHVNNSTDDDNDIAEQEYLQIDLASSANQSKTPCDDTLSYLCDYKIKKERVSGQVLL